MLAAMLFILARTPKRVMPIPATPTNIPSGIPAMLTKNPRKAHIYEAVLWSPPRRRAVRTALSVHLTK